MPTIKPQSYNDLVRFIKENRRDVETGVYDFVLDPGWIPQMSDEALEFFARRPRESATLASSRNTPEQLLRWFMQTDGAKFAASIANNPAAPEDLLELAALRYPDLSGWSPESHGFVSIQELVIRHPSITPSILKQLASSKSDKVVQAVAGHYRTPSETLEVLAKSDKEDIRAAAALNPNTPDRTLEILRRDASNRVSGAHSANLKVRRAEGRCVKCGTGLGMIRKLVGSNYCSNCS